jgi:hypothetical protein
VLYKKQTNTIVITDMKNFDLFIIAENLQAMIPALNTLKGAKLSYALTKNIKLIEDEINTIRKIVEPTDGFKAYDSARVQLCEKFCKKDENGELLKKTLDNGSFEYDIDTDSAEWNAAINELKEKHETDINDRAAQIQKYNEILELDAEVKFHNVKLDNIPDEITPELMRTIEFFVVE